MRPRSLVLLNAFIVAAVACAHSSPITNTGTGGADQSSSSVGGSGGSGVFDTGPSSGSALPCDEFPCKLTAPQCGCGASEQCTTDPTVLDPTFRVCVPQGIQGPGQKCMMGSAGCGPGLVCVQKAPTLNTCTPYCAADGDCVAPGGLCLLTLDDGLGGMIPNAALCTENCDPIANTGCVTGLACRLGTEATGLLRSYTRCLAVGGGTQKSPCTVNADCAAGFTCVNSGAATTVCGQYCRVGGTDCTIGLKCVALQANGKDVVLGGITYGACL
jgi:hypothetical protein